jgi:hypothetical protein
MGANQMEEKRGGCLKHWLIVLLILVVVGWIGNNCSGSSGSHYRSSGSSYSSSGSSYSSTAPKESSTEVPSQPSTWQFGDDAELIVKDIKEAFADYKVSWYVSGYKLSVTVKVQSLSGDDLADLYKSDAAGAQKSIDTLNDSMKSANSSVLQRFKTMGYNSPSVEFSIVTSDDMEICTVLNGAVTHSISAENFRYG